MLTLLEATVFPAPTEAMLLALSISRPKRAWVFAGVAALGSVTGGVLGYQLGATLYDEFGARVVAGLGLTEQMPAVEGAYRENAWLALATSGYTPIPYMLYTMAAGAFALPLPSFILASLVGRSLKYLPIAILAWAFGPAVRGLLERYAAWVGAAVTLLLLAAVMWRVQ